jgi:DNA-binding NarL/FixJ family response regulator
MRILLADDQKEIRSAMRLLLEHQPSLEIVGEVAEAGNLLRQTAALEPELLLIDWELPGFRPGKMMPQLRTSCPHLRLIALSGLPEARQAALDAGADDFVSKGDPPENLLNALNEQQRRDP